MAPASPSASRTSSWVSGKTSNFVTVDDEIVIRLVKQEIDKLEANKESWFLQGFPRTKVQALSLQRLRIVPDKLIHLNLPQKAVVNKISTNVTALNSNIYGSELDQLCLRLHADYMLNLNAIRDSFKQFIFEYDADRPEGDTQADLFKMLKLRYRSGAPRRPPRVVIIGPPGSGRSTQSMILAETFGLVHIHPEELIKAEAERNPGIKMKIKESLEKGEQVPDEIVLRLIDARMRQSDCRVNGWVLDGFPQSETQVNLLKSMRIKPTLVCLFEQAQDESVRRLGNRRLDPHTGELYNLVKEPPRSETVSKRLVSRIEDNETNVKKRYVSWNAAISLLEETYKNMLLSVASDKDIDAVAEQIMEAVENPVF